MFKVGQKVVCINDDGFEFFTPKLIKNEIYTIRTLIGIHLTVVEFGDDDNLRYFQTRFRPIDYRFGEKLAEEINQENLVNA